MFNVLLLILITTNLFLLSKNDIAISLHNPWLFLSQLFSLVGTVLLSLSFALGSRSRFLEKMFGGLDKVIKIHHIIGGLSFVLLLHHPLFLAVQALPNFKLASMYLFFSTNQTYNYGVAALYGMIILLLLTLVIKLPYHVWIKTHDMFGVVLLLASLHIYFISSDVSRYLPLRIWIFINIAVGFYFYIYKVFLYRWFGPKYKYKVTKVETINDFIEIELIPEGQKIKFNPGQFAFINFDSPDLDESHPFSFSSSPDDQNLRFTVKILGDYTLKLKNLRVGTTANVWGSYGKFYYLFRDKKDVVCIAGGVGITPFMSLLNYEVNHKVDRKIHLFYGAKSPAEAIYDNEIKQIQTNLSNLNYCPNFDGQKPRFSCQTLRQDLGDLNNKRFYICGPPAMMTDLADQLIRNGVKSSDIVFEDFNFKI